MPGKYCDGVKAHTYKGLINSRAYCEGIAARYAAVPPAVNPHAAGSEAAAAYTAGVALAAESAGTTVDPADAPCCAIPSGNVAEA